MMLHDQKRVKKVSKSGRIIHSDDIDDQNVGLDLRFFGWIASGPSKHLDGNVEICHFQHSVHGVPLTTTPSKSS